MKKLLIIFMIFLLSASVYAQEKKVLGIYMTDGTMVCFLLNEKPVLTFVDDAVKVVSTSEEALIKRSLVDHFEFLAEVPTDINDVKENSGVGENLELDGDAIRVSGLPQGCKVQVYSVNGQAQITAVAGEDGNVTLQLGSLSKGIYLVNYNETTIKFIKR
jgi:hypothetical protein